MVDAETDDKNAPGGAAGVVADAEAGQACVEIEAESIAFDFLINHGLYATVERTTELGEMVEEKLRNSAVFGFDAYCVNCRRETTFRISARDVSTRGIGGRYSAEAIRPTLFAVHAMCQRDWAVYTYIILAGENELTKIGQFPSAADIAFGELRAIDKSLDEIDRRELGKALGLFSHDSALGAFAYLRRVFERMINRAHERQANVGHKIDGFAGMRMDEKITTLKGELPELVVRNSEVFSILSLGLHELTEEQCAQHFSVIKAVLFQMLEQEEHKRKAAITQRETETALRRILSDPTGGTT